MQSSQSNSNQDAVSKSNIMSESITVDFGDLNDYNDNGSIHIYIFMINNGNNDNNKW